MESERRARTLLARNLRLLRFLRGWSQENLAAASGLHRTYISSLERGKCNASLDNVEKLASAFGLAVHELLHPKGASSSFTQHISPEGATPEDVVPSASVDSERKES